MPPEGPPTQARAATPTNSTSTLPSGTVQPHAHNPTESPNPQAWATPSTAAPGDRQTTAQAGAASQRHHAPRSGPAVRPTEPSSPGGPAPNPDPGPDWAHTTDPEEMEGPPQRTETPGPAGKPSGGVDQPAIQHADPAGMAAHGSS